MNTLSHQPSPPAKRPCSATFTPPDRLEMDAFTESFLFLSNSSSSSLNVFVDRLVDSATSDSNRRDVIERVLRLGSVLHEAGKRSERKLDYFHNSIVWPLPPDLTINVFSMLDTQSVCNAAATCTFFSKCALDPLCYANIDLLTAVPKVNNLVVSTMIQRAGKALRSIKLGLLSKRTSQFLHNDNRLRQGKESRILSWSCLNSLTVDSGASGATLRRLHLYNIERMDNTALSAALSACPSLLDLQITGLYYVELRKTLESVSHHCHLIERLHIESSKTGRDDSLKMTPTCCDLVQNCPHITSLALRGSQLQDYQVLTLVKGFRNLKYLDLSTSYSITGAFLDKLSAVGGDLLEVVMLSDCVRLKKAEVERFLNAVLAGDFKFLRHLDISNREGLATEDDWSNRCYSQSFIPLDKLYEVRPNFCLLAEFGSYIDVDSDMDVSMASHSTASDSSLFISTSGSSYDSDQGSDNERDMTSLVYDESSDELGFLSGHF